MEGKPKEVEEVIIGATNDVKGTGEHRKAMSSKGGRTAARNRHEEKLRGESEEKSRVNDAAIELAKQCSVSPEGDVLPPGQEEAALLEQQGR